MPDLTTPRFILASQSPRRAEILRRVGLSFGVEPSNVDESSVALADPRDTVVQLARMKAHAVHEQHPHDIVVSADTVVAIDGEILGKPRDDAEAAQMLRKLSGRAHRVLTGFAIIDGARKIEKTGCEETMVVFREMNEREIDWYVSSGEPRDKAGAYAIQGLGGLFVERIEGNYYNVVGFPLTLFVRLMEKIGISLLDHLSPLSDAGEGNALRLKVASEAAPD